MVYYIQLGLGILFIVNMLSASCHDERQQKVLPLLPFLPCTNEGGLGYSDVKKQSNQDIIHFNKVSRVALHLLLLKHYGIICDYEVKKIFLDLIIDEEESCDKDNYSIKEYGPMSVDNDPLGVGRIRFPVVLRDKELEVSLNSLQKDKIDEQYYPLLVLKCSSSLDSLKWPDWKAFFCAVDQAWNNSATKSMVFDDFMMMILSFWVRGSDVQLNGDCTQAVVTFCYGYRPVDFSSLYENIRLIK
ncbi:MAG: hypothetical protein WBQ73_01380 [Candidatus Babeliales bacterium]